MSDVKTINGPMRDDGLSLFRKQWNEACKAAGLVSIGKDTAAKLLAIVYVLGGDSPRMLKQRLREMEEQLTERLKQYIIEHSND